MPYRFAALLTLFKEHRVERNQPAAPAVEEPAELHLEMQEN